MDTAWAIVGVIVPILIGLAVSVIGLNPPGYLMARCCLVLAALLFGSTALFWQIRSGQQDGWRITAGIAIWVTIGVGLPESLRWINKREQATSLNATLPQTQVVQHSAAMPALSEPNKMSSNISSKDGTYRPPLPLANMTLPIVMQTRILNNGTAFIANKGKVAVQDIQCDFSSHLLDVDYSLLKSQNVSDVMPPVVEQSNFAGGSLSIHKGRLEPDEYFEYDLNKSVPFMAFPAKTNDEATWKALTDTVFVFRFTFRDTRTGERYACFKVHGSYLQYPSGLNDDSSSGGTAIAEKLYLAMTEAAINASRGHYPDGAKEIRCER